MDIVRDRFRNQGQSIQTAWLDPGFRTAAPSTESNIPRVCACRWANLTKIYILFILLRYSLDTDEIPIGIVQVVSSQLFNSAPAEIKFSARIQTIFFAFHTFSAENYRDNLIDFKSTQNFFIFPQIHFFHNFAGFF